MGQFIKDYIIGKEVFWVCLCTSLLLLILGFVLPPRGIIDPSVLKGVGELFAFATLGVVFTCVSEGINAKMKKGDVEIELNANKE